jgi:hypothetical protein
MIVLSQPLARDIVWTSVFSQENIQDMGETDIATVCDGKA